MNKYGYSVWKEKPTSRPSLIITDDDGRTFNKVAVFRNEECAKVFDMWIEGILRECTDRRFKHIADDIDNRLARMIGGAEDE